MILYPTTLLNSLIKPSNFSDTIFRVEEIPFVQGKEQQLRFAEAAVKRYSMSKVRETQVRQQVLQEASEDSHTNHNHRKLVNLITLRPQPCLTQ